MTSQNYHTTIPYPKFKTCKDLYPTICFLQLMTNKASEIVEQIEFASFTLKYLYLYLCRYSPKKKKHLLRVTAITLYYDGLVSSLELVSKFVGIYVYNITFVCHAQLFIHSSCWMLFSSGFSDCPRLNEPFFFPDSCPRTHCRTILVLGVSIKLWYYDGCFSNVD